MTIAWATTARLTNDGRVVSGCLSAILHRPTRESPDSRRQSAVSRDGARRQARGPSQNRVQFLKQSTGGRTEHEVQAVARRACNATDCQLGDAGIDDCVAHP